MTDTGKSDAFSDAMLGIVRHLSPENLALTRNVSFGGAGSLTAILLVFLQDGTSTLSLRVSLFACAVGIPSFIIHAKLIGHYIFFGQVSYSRLRRFWPSACLSTFFYLGAVSLTISLAAILWSRSATASVVFLAICAAGVVFELFNRHQVKASVNASGNRG